MKFTEEELGIISNALWVAVDTFRKDSGELQNHYGNSATEGIKRLIEQLGRQQYEAKQLYDRIAAETGIQR